MQNRHETAIDSCTVAHDARIDDGHKLSGWQVSERRRVFKFSIGGKTVCLPSNCLRARNLLIICALKILRCYWMNWKRLAQGTWSHSANQTRVFTELWPHTSTQAALCLMNTAVSTNEARANGRCRTKCCTHALPSGSVGHLRQRETFLVLILSR